MGTHEYLNTRGYQHSGYPRGYGAGTGIIFIKRGGHGYLTIRIHGYPLTSLVLISQGDELYSCYLLHRLPPLCVYLQGPNPEIPYV